MINKNNKLSQFGKNIAKYRKQKKLTQNQLAELLDITREHLAKIETAKRGISINLLFKISETDDPEMETFVKKTITFTGYFTELIIDENYIL